jgi:hypothetical protein
MSKYLFLVSLFLVLIASNTADAKKKKYPNNDYYEGEWGKGQPNGIGKMVYANGSTYIGSWINGKRTGTGKMIYDTHDVYEGGWLDDLKNGYGVLEYSNGDSFKGEWFDDKEKNGTLTLIRGDLYQGEWNNRSDGCGNIIYKNGDKFDGDWQNFLPEGKGRMAYFSDKTIKEGLWKDGYLYEGSEIRVTKLGKCKVEYIKGKRNGLGTIDIDSDLFYIGQMTNFLPEGKGKLLFGSISWEGYFKDGKPVDRGVVSSYSIKDTLSIKIVNNIIQGTIKYPDGQDAVIEYGHFITYSSLCNWVGSVYKEIEEKSREAKEEALLQKINVQNLKTYRNEDYKFGSFIGPYHKQYYLYVFDDVEYQYATTERGSVLHGEFHIWNGTYWEEFRPAKYSVQGKFKYGQKDGIWIFEESCRGSKRCLKVNYRNDKITGILSLESYDSAGTLVYRNEANFNNGKWERNNSKYYFYDKINNTERRTSYDSEGNLNGEVFLRKGDIVLRQLYSIGNLIESEKKNIRKGIVLTPKGYDSSFDEMWELVLPNYIKPGFRYDNDPLVGLIHCSISENSQYVKIESQF